MQVATKLHYTIDVFAANLLAVAVWRFYHHAVASERVKEQYAVLRTPSRTNRLASELWIVGWIVAPGLLRDLPKTKPLSSPQQASAVAVWAGWLEAEEVMRIDARAYRHWKQKGALSGGVVSPLLKTFWRGVGDQAQAAAGGGSDEDDKSR